MVSESALRLYEFVLNSIRCRGYRIHNYLCRLRRLLIEAPILMKVCPKCNKPKNDDEFYKQNGKPHGYCKICNSLKCKSYYKDHDEEIKEKVRSLEPDYKRHCHLRTQYKLSVDSYYEQLAFQEHKCKICKKEFSKTIRPVVDHDHKCCPTKAKSCGNCLRGIICHKCNSILGYSFESEDILLEAIKYSKESIWECLAPK